MKMREKGTYLFDLRKNQGGVGVGINNWLVQKELNIVVWVLEVVRVQTGSFSLKREEENVKKKEKKEKKRNNLHMGQRH